MDKQPVIVYVEDDMLSRKVMQMILCKRLGLQHVTIFEDSSDVVDRVKSLDPKPDVVFLDIHMEPYSGLELLQMLRELPQLADVPIIAMTASVMSEEVEQLRKAGFDGCIGKPIDSDTFPKHLDSILKREKVWFITN